MPHKMVIMLTALIVDCYIFDAGHCQPRQQLCKVLISLTSLIGGEDDRHVSRSLPSYLLRNLSGYGQAYGIPSISNDDQKSRW